jgi:hypothetical protein
MAGDGSGVPHGRVRFIVEIDSVAYWRLWNEIARRRGWTP